MGERQRTRILGVVPARGGSKRFVKKNTQLLGGKTLVEHALTCAANCRDLTDIVCASDSDEILQCAMRFFSHTPGSANTYTVKLPPSLTLDHSLLAPVVRYCIAELEVSNSATPISTVVLLQPTSPFRYASDLSNALVLHKRSGKNVVSVSPVPSTLEKLLLVDGSGFVQQLTSKEAQLSQHGTKIFAQNGAVYVVNRQSIYLDETWVDSDSIAYEMPSERGIDIDTEKDLRMAEMMLQQGVVRDEFG